MEMWHLGLCCLSIDVAKTFFAIFLLIWCNLWYFHFFFLAAGKWRQASYFPKFQSLC